MLIDSDHPTGWSDPARLGIAGVGDFGSIAHGETSKRYWHLSMEQVIGLDHLVSPGRSSMSCLANTAACG
jgi:hypothetical protein